MTTAKTTTCGSVDAEVTIADLQDIGGSTASRTVSATMPAPAIIRDETATTCAEGVLLSVALSQCRGVVDIWFAYMCMCGCS